MPAIGGYAVLLQIKENKLNELITLAHTEGLLTRHINTEFSASGHPDKAEADAKVMLGGYLSAPKVLLPMQKSTDGLFEAEFRVAGYMSIFDSPTVTAESRLVRLSIKVGLALSVDIVKEKVPMPNGTNPELHQANLRFATVNVRESNLALVDGKPIPQSWINYFSEDDFKKGMSLQLFLMLRDVKSILPTDTIPLMDFLGLDEGSQVSGVCTPGSGYLNIALDVSLNSGSVSINTQGKSSQLSKRLFNSDISVSVSSALEPLMAKIIQDQINQGPGNVTISNFKLNFTSGHIDVSGYAETPDGDGDFSFDLYIHRGRPGYTETVDDEYTQYNIYHPPTLEVWTEAKNINVDPDAGWFGEILLAVTYPFLFSPTPLGAARQAIQSAITSGIALAHLRIQEIVGSNNVLQLLVKQDKRLVGPLGPVSTLILDKISVHSNSLLILESIENENEPKILGPLKVDAKSLEDYIGANPNGSNKKIRYYLPRVPIKYDFGRRDPKPPEDPDNPTALEIEAKERANRVKAGDPELFVRWRLTRKDTNELLVERENLYDINLKFASIWVDYAYYSLQKNITEFKLAVKVFRKAGGKDEPIYYGSVDLEVTDRLDRSHPFVKWKYTVRALGLGARLIDRESVIHKTALPGRCRFADYYSKHVKKLKYLDSLPFSKEHLQDNKKLLCPYCFFGGPHKDELTDPKPF